MRKLTIPAALTAALGLAGCGAGHPAVNTASAGTVAIAQAGGGEKPSKSVQEMADKACLTSGNPAKLASASKAPDGKTEYLFFCH